MSRKLTDAQGLIEAIGVGKADLPNAKSGSSLAQKIEYGIAVCYAALIDLVTPSIEEPFLHAVREGVLGAIPRAIKSMGANGADAIAAASHGAGKRLTLLALLEPDGTTLRAVVERCTLTVPRAKGAGKVKGTGKRGREVLVLVSSPPAKIGTAEAPLSFTRRSKLGLIFATYAMRPSDKELQQLPEHERMGVEGVIPFDPTSPVGAGAVLDRYYVILSAQGAGSQVVHDAAAKIVGMGLAEARESLGASRSWHSELTAHGAVWTYANAVDQSVAEAVQVEAVKNGHAQPEPGPTVKKEQPAQVK